MQKISLIAQSVRKLSHCENVADKSRDLSLPSRHGQMAGKNTSAKILSMVVLVFNPVSCGLSLLSNIQSILLYSSFIAFIFSIIAPL